MASGALTSGKWRTNLAARPVQIRMMFGNGLRPQIWENFQKRFNIPKICEFYGSTEGNANIGQWQRSDGGATVWFIGGHQSGHTSGAGHQSGPGAL